MPSHGDIRNTAGMRHSDARQDHRSRCWGWSVYDEASVIENTTPYGDCARCHIAILIPSELAVDRQGLNYHRGCLHWSLRA